MMMSINPTLSLLLLYYHCLPSVVARTWQWQRLPSLSPTLTNLSGNLNNSSPQHSIKDPLFLLPPLPNGSGVEIEKSEEENNRWFLDEGRDDLDLRISKKQKFA